MIRETARIIDQTAPHQLVVAKVLGALNCTDLLRVIKTEGAHPFAATTDGMADMRGAADLVVSFDGGFKYGLAIEVKTTTQADASAGPIKLFKDVKNNIERNQRQFDRLIGSTPAWWYIVVHIGKLTAKTVSEMDRALLDCPAALFEGKYADDMFDEVLGIKPLGELLDLVSDRLKLLGTLAPLPSPQVQLDMLDGLPVVTLDTPLKAPVWTAPPITPSPVVKPAFVEVKRRYRSATLTDPSKVLPNKNMKTMLRALIEVWDQIGEAEIKARSTAHPDLCACYEQMKTDRISALKNIKSSFFFGLAVSSGMHDAVVFAIAMQKTMEFKSSVARSIMPEGTFLIENDPGNSCNVLGRVGYDLVREIRRTRPR